MSGFELEGLDDLIRDLAEFGDKSMPGLQDVSNRAADVILHRAKAKVHVSEDEDKTHLRDLLVSRKGRTTKLKGGKKSALARVTFKKGGEHAVPLELGHKLVIDGQVRGKVQPYPFLRPAADESKEEINQMIISEMNKQLEGLKG